MNRHQRPVIHALTKDQSGSTLTEPFRYHVAMMAQAIEFGVERCPDYHTEPTSPVFYRVYLEAEQNGGALVIVHDDGDEQEPQILRYAPVDAATPVRTMPFAVALEHSLTRTGGGETLDIPRTFSIMLRDDSIEVFTPNLTLLLAVSCVERLPMVTVINHSPNQAPQFFRLTPRTLVAPM